MFIIVYYMFYCSDYIGLVLFSLLACIGIIYDGKLVKVILQNKAVKLLSRISMEI